MIIMYNITGVRLDQGLQTTTREPTPACEDISSQNSFSQWEVDL